ncbi:hypothetical protein UFOVP434_8 [uncultured Caudovirales phage]|uniref:Uncharacterized protein n=1 Tax=uncultured Caudovirales phage TaxID=2100421 RepID=A0A6J5M8B9_9CAUD|nr:hypothetical protein UFOVP434_8 [uncultured Caudovirales phage]
MEFDFEETWREIKTNKERLRNMGYIPVSYSSCQQGNLHDAITRTQALIQQQTFVNPQIEQKKYICSYCLRDEKQGCGCGAKDWIEKKEK